MNKTNGNEEIFRGALESIVETAETAWNPSRRTTINLGVGEALDIDPNHPLGRLFRLVSYQEHPRRVNDSSFPFVVRHGGGLRFLPWSSLGRFEASTRMFTAENAASALVYLSLNQS